jgi:hypothetical protein
LVGKGIAQIDVKQSAPRTGSARAAYIGQYTVLEASDYAAFESNVGQVVELVGQVVSVVKTKTKTGDPCIFVNFKDYKENRIVSLTIWNNALVLGGVRPENNWRGGWVTIRGLVQPVYPRDPLAQNKSVSINVTSLSQIQQISSDEAKYRLGQVPPKRVAPANKELLGKLEKAQSGEVNSPRPAAAHYTPQPSKQPANSSAGHAPLSRNQQLLRSMQAPQPSPPPPPPPSAPKVPPPATPMSSTRFVPERQKPKIRFRWWLLALVLIWVAFRLFK